MVLICSYCGKLYLSNKSLNLHVRRKHLDDLSFFCAHCPFESCYKSSLKEHISTNHIKLDIKKRKKKSKKKVPKCTKIGDLIVQEKFRCTTCGKTFTRKNNMARHTQLYHIEDAKNHLLKECAYCSKKFRDKGDLVKHIKFCRYRPESSEFMKEKSFFTCAIPECGAIYDCQYLMKMHYEKIHDTKFEYENFVFESKEKFEEWLLDYQHSTLSQFYLSRMWKSSTSRNKKMICHRTGFEPAEISHRKRSRKLSGSKKINGFCPAEIVIKTSEDETYLVRIQKIHVGHLYTPNEEIKFLSLNKREKSEIVGKLVAGVPLSSVLPYQASVPSQHIECTSVINYDNIENVAAAFNVGTKYHGPFADDPRNVLGLIDDHRESILLFKAEGVDDIEYGVLGKDDFAIVYMNKFQEELLMKFGNNVIAYDSTHKTNPNDFLIQSILVIDDDWEGVAVAFLLSNRNDTTMLEIFLQCIKKKTGLLTPITIMTDMQESFLTAFEVVMRAPKFALWYLWHVYECWRKNQNKIKNSDKRIPTLATLYEVSQITDVEIFQMKMEEFLNNTDPDLQLFIRYIQEKYASKAIHWAYCYRIGSRINTNMVAESFHNFFKTKVGGKKKMKTVYECLKTLYAYLDVKDNYTKMKFIHPQITQKSRILRARHHTAVKYESHYTVNAFGSNMWLVSSFPQEKKKPLSFNQKNNEEREEENEEFKSCSTYIDDEERGIKDDNDGDTECLQIYFVQRCNSFKKSSTSLKCRLCNISFDEFQCTCIDYLMKCNMCKHIHAVALYCKKNVNQFKCSNRTDDGLVNTKNNFDNDIQIPITSQEQLILQQMKDDIKNGIENLNDVETLKEIWKIILQ